MGRKFGHISKEHKKYQQKPACDGAARSGGVKHESEPPHREAEPGNHRVSDGARDRTVPLLNEVSPPFLSSLV